MSEFVDILDLNGNKTGQVLSREKAHKEKLPYGYAVLWLVNSSGNILIQRRGCGLNYGACKWDKSVGGGVDAGESFDDAIVRETKEEIGLSIDKKDIRLLGNFSYKVFKGLEYVNLFTKVYVLKGDFKISDMNPDINDVLELKYVSLDWIKNNLLQDGNSESVIEESFYNLLKDWFNK